MDNEFYKGFGAVIFNNPQDTNDGGYACIHGETPFFIEGTGMLQTGIYWITNLEFEEYHRSAISKSPRFRQENFLRTRISSLLIEMGLKDSPVSDQAEAIAHVFGNVMYFADVQLGMNSVPHKSLSHGLRQIFIKKEEVLSEDVLKASEQAVQTFTICEKSSADTKKKTQLISLIHHRYEYANQLISQKYPSSSWRPVGADCNSGPQSERINYIKQASNPMLIRITIHSVSDEMNRIISYGSGAGYLAANTKQGQNHITLNDHSWVTSIECLKLLQHCDLEIHEAYIADGWRTCPVTIPAWGNFVDNSYSFGLYCECLWTSITKKLDGNIATTPLAAWITGLDRLICMNSALKIASDENLTISSYGYGRVTLQVDEEEALRLPDLALKLRMISPPSLLQREGIVPPDRTASRAEIMQYFMMSGQKDFIREIDNRAIEEIKKVRNSDSTNVAPTM